MMRPMKLAGSELMFGEGCLEYIKTIKVEKVSIVVGGKSMERSGMLAKVEGYFHEAGAETMVISGVEPDPSFETVMRGAQEMLGFGPDLIVGLGGGSAMDAAKAMWIFYEHPELKTMESVLPPNEFPKLREKARLCCIPSTSGTASEVSRSIVISDNETGLKHGLGAGYCDLRSGSNGFHACKDHSRNRDGRSDTCTGSSGIQSGKLYF